MTKKSQKRKKRYKRDLSVTLKLTERDRDIIRWIYRHRFMSSSQIISLIGGSEQGLLRRLSLLFHAGYLDRPKSQRIFFGSNHHIVYGLGNKGAEILAAEYDLPIESVNWARKNREAKGLFLEHTLMVSQFMVVVRLACRKEKDIEFIETEELVNNRPKPPTIKTHCLSWRVDVKKGEYGQNRRFSFNMIPDAGFGLRVRKENKTRELYFFLEADRSTMPVKRKNFYRSSFHKKMVGYVASFRGEYYSKYFGFKKIRILTLAKSQKRIKSMIRASKQLHETGKGYNLFLFIQDKEIILNDSSRIFKKIWVDGRGKNLSIY